MKKENSNKGKNNTVDFGVAILLVLLWWPLAILYCIVQVSDQLEENNKRLNTKIK